MQPVFRGGETAAFLERILSRKGAKLRKCPLSIQVLSKERVLK